MNLTHTQQIMVLMHTSALAGHSLSAMLGSATSFHALSCFLCLVSCWHDSAQARWRGCALRPQSSKHCLLVAGEVTPVFSKLSCHPKGVGRCLSMQNLFAQLLFSMSLQCLSEIPSPGRFYVRADPPASSSSHGSAS